MFCKNCGKPLVKGRCVRCHNDFIYPEEVMSDEEILKMWWQEKGIGTAIIAIIVFLLFLLFLRYKTRGDEMWRLIIDILQFGTFIVEYNVLKTANEKIVTDKKVGMILMRIIISLGLLTVLFSAHLYFF